LTALSNLHIIRKIHFNKRRKEGEVEGKRRRDREREEQRYEKKEKRRG
jgi:hypothetical protein